MTVFWSDPTKIRLTLPAGDELEEENYFQEPKNLEKASSPEGLGAKLRDVLGITGPGVAEIKPHNSNGIAKAIEQLQKYNTLPPSSRGRVMEARNRPLTKVIITYRPTGWSLQNRNPSPLTLDVYATKFEPKAGHPPPVGDGKKVTWRNPKTNKDVELTRPPGRGGGVRPFLKGTDVSYYHTQEDGQPPRPAQWVLIAEKVAIPPTIPVNLDNGSVLGAAAEAPVRKAFAAALRKARRYPYDLDKPSDDTGADVVWTEIAEMYAELARTTNDEFLAELANELAALR